VQEGDRAPEEVEALVRREVQRIVETIPSLDQPHHIIVHRSRGDPQGYFISLECTAAADTPVEDAHELSHLLERELSAQLDGIVDVIIHLEPPGSS